MDFFPFILIAVVTVAASFIQSVTGFGFGIFAMIFLPHILIYTEANVLSTVLSAATSVTVAVALFRKINWKNIIFPILGFFPGAYASVAFVGTQKSELLTLLLGIALLSLSVFFFFFSSKIKIKPSWYTGLFTGALSGVMGGLFSISGPPAVIYFIQTEDDSERYLATLSAYFIFADSISIATKAAAGFVTKNVWIGILFGAVGMVAGSIVGKKTRDKIKPQTIKKAVYAVMAFSGIVNIISSILSF